LREESIDNCSFLQKWDLFMNTVDMVIPHPFNLYILYGIGYGRYHNKVGNYLAHLVNDVPVEILGIGIDDNIYGWRVAVTNNFIYIYSTAFEWKNTEGFCNSSNGAGYMVVEQYTLSGVLLNRWGCVDLGVNYYNIEDAISVDGEDNFYILGEETENGDFLIAKFNTDGNFLSQWRLGPDPDHVGVHRDLAINDKNLYVLLGGKKIKKLTLDGELIQEWNIDDFFEKTSILKTISLTSDGNIFTLGRHGTSEDYNPMVIAFNSEGEMVGRWERCRDEDGNVKEIVDSGILAVEPLEWEEGQHKTYKAYIGEDIYLLERDF